MREKESVKTECGVMAPKGTPFKVVEEREESSVK